MEGDRPSSDLKLRARCGLHSEFKFKEHTMRMDRRLTPVVRGLRRAVQVPIAVPYETSYGMKQRCVSAEPDRMRTGDSPTTLGYLLAVASVQVNG